MIDDDNIDDEREFAPHRGTRFKLDRAPKKTKWEIAASLCASDLEQNAAFAASVRVTNAERAWILEHLLPFHRAKLIDDVVYRVKAGKEATVYACSGHPSSGRALLAAKLYRARSHRSLKNTTQYQEGRAVLNAAGLATSSREWRLSKAIAQKSRVGLAAVQTSWLMHEFVVMKALHAAGADVPEPIEHGEQALIMEFVGDGSHAAPTLNEVALGQTEAKELLQRVVHDLELLLGFGWVHGDLSAHNILYQEGRIALIDFPQVVDCRNNPQARALFERDVERVAQFFRRAGATCDHAQLARRLWSKYVPL